jgi:putative transposase
VQQPSPFYKRHRFPGEVISHAVWLYYRFLLSHRDVEELLAERGIAVSYETIRRWCRKFGPAFANGLRRRRPCPGDKWHLGEGQLKINGRKHWLWRAVDQAGVVLDVLVEARRNQEAAEAFPRRVVDGCGYQPRVVITDKLASYPPARRRVLPGAEHRRHKGLMTAPRTRIGPPADENGCSSGSSPRRTPSSSSPPSVPSPTTFAPVATSSPPPRIARCC